MYQVPEEIQSRSGVDTDADRVRGLIIASSFLEVANKPANLRKIGAVASIIGVGQLIFEGATVENFDWENETNWKQYGGDTVEICEQTDVEQATPTENTKATSSLRAWQGFLFWCANTIFAGLNTTAKTIIGAINELLSVLDLKAMQFVGVCKRINFKPSGIVIDSVNNTISITSVNGVAISESNPFRCFTDGDGIVVQHIITTPVSASFTNTSGVWYVHFDSNGDFICTQTPWSDFDTVATIYRFYLNATLPDNEKIVSRAYEAHENVMSSETHQVLHNGFGTIHVNGFDLIHNVLPINASGVPTVNPNADGRNAVISLTEGKNSDDGLEYHVTHSVSPTLSFSQNLGEQSVVSLNSSNSGLFKIRTNDVNGLLNFLPATRFPFAFNPTSNVPQFITSTGVRTDVPDNHWFVYYVYALQDDKVGEPIKVVSAEVSFATFALAQNHDWINLQLLYPTLRDKEIRPLYKLIFYANYIVPNVYDAGSKYCGLVNVTDIRTIRPSTITTSGGGGGLVLASNVIVTPPSGYTSTDQQSFDNELASNTLKGNTTVHSPLIDDDSFGVWDSVGNVFKRISAVAIKAYVKSNLLATEVLNNSTNKTGANVKLVIDNLVNHYQQATAPTIESTPALKKDDTWLDTTTLIKYAYTADSNNVLNWVNVNQCGAEIPNVESGERVVTKSTTGVQVAKTLLDMQIAAGTIASANWSTGQATYTGQQGQTTYDANYKYECIGTNKWIRTALMEARLQLYLSPDIDDSLGAKTSAELDTAYPTAVIGQRVWGMLFLYEKKTTNIWKKISAITA
jgi:hypothetical protein